MMNHLLAIAFLLLVLAAIAAAIVWAFRRSPYTPSETVLFYLDVLLCRLLWRVDLPATLPEGCENGAVIIANHRSPVDPFFIQLVPGRKVHWMVAAEYFSLPVVAWFLRKTGAIPTRRGGADTGAIRAAIRYAREGGLVGMFPEGRINKTDEFLLPVRPGAALVALRARAPVLPCYIEGAPYDGRRILSPFFMRARVKVRFGNPIDLSEHYDAGKERHLAKELTLRAMKEIARLAGREDYEPQLAGRKWMPEENGAADADSEAAEESAP
ncbi:MAG: 1-acyl-sn-glycerol-3-phosphate acyltransferase [Planctomycetes bacterium]|nr:1-acyl-sn-glycerol-3-phosphate acyltransferase [Planctomycetota bacterium]